MTAPAKITAFVAMLGVVFAAAVWMGTVFGPNPDIAVPGPATTEQVDHHGDHQP